jgi:hypothetical protein
VLTGWLLSKYEIPKLPWKRSPQYCRYWTKRLAWLKTPNSNSSALTQYGLHP